MPPLSPRIEDPSQLRQVNVFLVPLAQHLDFNVIGRGQVAEIDTDVLIERVVERLDEGATLDLIGLELVDAYRAGDLSRTGGRPSPDQPATHVGGYLVTEFEYHREPNGEFVPLAEINQARLYFAASLNPFAAQSRFSALVEWNPVPEEVIHQIDAISLDDGGVIEPTEAAIEGLVPFERAYVQVDELGGAPVTLSLGQFRLPFGLWSDVTSHRNFTTTKNNVLVHGFALKKIELGALTTVKAGGLAVDAAVVHGRLARTSPLDRADGDSDLDLVTRVRADSSLVQASVSSYFVAFDPRDVALGASLSVTPRRLTISGEFVYQSNPDADQLYDSVTQLASIGGYGQVEVMVHPRWRAYGMYEAWQLSVDGDAYGAPAGKIFHGVRYLPHQQVRWTILEYGHMLHQGYDEGTEHLSTQLEVTF